MDAKLYGFCVVNKNFLLHSAFLKSLASVFDHTMYIIAIDNTYYLFVVIVFKLLTYFCLPLGVGYAICLLDVYVGMHYNTIIGWAVYYLIASFQGELPWTNCNNEWNTPNCTPVTMLRPNMTATTPAREFFE